VTRDSLRVRPRVDAASVHARVVSRQRARAGRDRAGGARRGEPVPEDQGVRETSRRRPGGRIGGVPPPIRPGPYIAPFALIPSFELMSKVIMKPFVPL